MDARTPLPKAPDARLIDRYISVRLKLARCDADLSQEDVADHLGMSPDFVSYIERGRTRVSAGRLYQLSVLYSKPVSWFFEGAQA